MIALLRTLALLLALAGAGPARAEPLHAPADLRTQQQIARLFEEARAALDAGQGGAVLPLLSRATLARLEAIRSAARIGSAAGSARLSPAERVAALTLQRFMPPNRLRELRTAELADAALAEHWLSPGTIHQASLGPVTVEGLHADAPLLVKGKPGLISVAFIREGGQWRIDLTPTVAVADGLLSLFASLAGVSEDDYAGKLVARLHAPAR